jgi:GMP synthase (glutamine-hydrolysing)
MLGSLYGMAYDGGIMKPVLILQLRPEDEAADGEFAAFLAAGGLGAHEVRRIRMEREAIPELDVRDYAAIVVGGGPSDVCTPLEQQSPEQQRFEPELHGLLDQVMAYDHPYFGACYGLGILAQHLGGRVSKERYGESVEAVTIRLTAEAASDPLTAGLPLEFRAFAGHKEACQEVPPGAVLLGSSAACPVHMVRVKQNIYATQFHPELDGPGIVMRINIYKDAGYFPPADADRLTRSALKEQVTVPEEIFRRFVERYRG